jgi:hypothetical protein
VRQRLPCLFRFAHLAQVIFFVGDFFSQEFATNTGGIFDVCDTLTSGLMFT